MIQNDVNFIFNTNTDAWDLNINFGVRQLAKKGLLAWEYNPLKVLRFQEDQYEKDPNGTYSKTEDGQFILEDLGGDKYSISIYKNELSDLDTDKFNFDLLHPVFIEALESYDGSVNLILNDNKNIPRMINTRFSTTGYNQYQIVERTVDSNIYDHETFDIQTSLYKRVSTIANLEFIGIRENGNLKVGNYTFYFKLTDGDGNETDWIALSNIVSCHIGNIRDPFSMRGGMENENSYKQVEFKLSNLDPAYNYVSVYYSRTTSSLDLNTNTEVFRVDKLYNISNLESIVNITGFETTLISSIEELNALYIVVDTVKTQTLCDNMLFFGNVKELEIDYEEFTDLSLRITPELTHVGIGHVNENYIEDSNDDTDPQKLRKYEYYNVNNIYNYLGYWDDEFYRLGVVYILNNYTLSPVFNIRGINELSCDTKFNEIPVYKDKNYKNLEHPTRNRITRDKNTYEISYRYIEDGELTDNLVKSPNENSKGVIKINYNDLQNLQLGRNLTNAIGFNFNIPEDLLYTLKGKVKGLFFVRQKRNKTTLCLTIPILTDKVSHLPALPTSETEYIMESIVSDFSDCPRLTHNFSARSRIFNKGKAENSYLAAICPDYILNLAYYNLFFTGTEFVLKPAKSKLELDYFSQKDNHFYSISYEPSETEEDITKMYVVSVPDGIQLVKGRLKDNWFASAAGYETDPLKVSYIGIDGSMQTSAPYGNTIYVTRGNYGPYIGLENKTSRLPTLLYNIKIPNYTDEELKDYIDIRCRSTFPFYAISPRVSIEDVERTDIDEYSGDKIKYVHSKNNFKITNIFGGDCFIGNFSFRMNRNFLNPEAPTNDIILDGLTWGRNYRRTESSAGEHNSKIILGDVYAVRLGHYGTVKMCSNYNVSLRSTDPYIPTEVGLTGHKRTFYPYTPMSTLGSYKIPESCMMNAGFNQAVGEQYNVECPDVPAIKNNFSTRVLYSDIAVQNSFRNGYRIFRDQHYQDYTTAHGALVSLIEKSGDIFCTFEHATGYLPVSANQLQTDLKNLTVFLTTANVLPDVPLFLNSEFGSLWQESVIKTPTCLYGVDTVAKRIWRVALEGGLRPQFKLKTISDFKVLRFLNENITLGEYETVPTIGIRNVKTHYNAFKGDLMFTFYDDVDTVEEKAWNLCFNEILEKFTTFYSWIPSFSSNINNIFFTFDRDTSKYISKLYSNPSLIKLEGSNSNNDSAYILELNNFKDGTYEIGTIIFSGLSEYSSLEKKVQETEEQFITINYEIEDSKDSSKFKFKEKSNILCISDTYLEELKTQLENEKNNEEFEGKLFKIPIKITVTIDYSKISSRDTGQSSRKLYTNFAFATPNYYNQIKNTAFWKHGQAGLMETKDILPTNWYGKLHPFEFEFIVCENLLVQKIFNNLQIIANKAKPESFHFEIVGESYTFADDKKNIFWRLEALKHIMLWNGENIVFNKKYEDITPQQRKEWYMNYYDKSTILPLYYYRNDSTNEIYDSYKKITSLSQDYLNMIGTEVVYDKLLGEFKLCTHTPARYIDYGLEVEIDRATYETLKHTSNIPVIDKITIENEGTDQEKIIHNYYKFINYGRRLGNCQYKEDEWFILIPPILYVLKNEDWKNETKTNYPPLNIYYTPVLEYMKNPNQIQLPYELKDDYTYTVNNNNKIGKWWQFEKWVEGLTRLRDKFIRIKVRYSGEDLAIIYAIKTMYTISYS